MDILKSFQNAANPDEIEKQLMTLDSEFQFKCRKCGKCCKHQDTVLFTPRDVFNIARQLGKTPQTVVEEYAEMYIGYDSHIPVVHMVPRGSNAVCPFLEDGRCSIHESKPTACALYPLGRVLITDVDAFENTLSPEKMGCVRYVLNDIMCGSRNRTYTVREWLARFNVPENDEFFLLWNNTAILLRKAMDNMINSHVSDKTLRTMWNTTGILLYLDYDTSKDFLPQFRRTCEKISAMCYELEVARKKLDENLSNGF